jgi:hypothetical protein
MLVDSLSNLYSYEGEPCIALDVAPDQLGVGIYIRLRFGFIGAQCKNGVLGVTLRQVEFGCEVTDYVLLHGRSFFLFLFSLPASPYTHNNVRISTTLYKSTDHKDDSLELSIISVNFCLPTAASMSPNQHTVIMTPEYT